MPEERVSRDQKHARNRERLTAAAQTVLREKGYAKTSLREIATAAEVPLGTLHYYFNGKSDLMISAFRAHQDAFVQGILTVARSNLGAQEKCRQMAATWSRAMNDNGPSYRIWYDLRNQALFEPELRPIVTDMEERLVNSIAELISDGQPPGEHLIKRIREHYLPMLGGLFHLCLQRIAFGEPFDRARQMEGMAAILDQLLDERRDKSIC